MQPPLRWARVTWAAAGTSTTNSFGRCVHHRPLWFSRESLVVTRALLLKSKRVCPQIEDVSPEQGPVGVNVWITLSPVTAAAGGLAVANGSATASWHQKCRSAIAGFSANGIPETCDLARLSPECNAYMEDRKLVYDMKPGDALISSRYSFHRGVAHDEDDAKIRFTLRYEPAGARLAGPFCGTPGVALEDAGFRFPQVWPRARPTERAIIAARSSRLVRAAIGASTALASKVNAASRMVLQRR
mmetsp:Transcript_4296/g.11909  ORF Transcript_4296/g.11909 Transcript_4296/m.11909 type:complete len:244 (+) Transcript_4296:335-1066(+)